MGDGGGGDGSGGGGGGSGGGGDGGDDVARLIDAADNEFVMSNPKSGATELQQDLRLISDLVVVLVSAAIGALLFTKFLGLPSAVGYIAAGSLVGPGGFKLVDELVQARSSIRYFGAFIHRCIHSSVHSFSGPFHRSIPSVHSIGPFHRSIHWSIH